MPKCKWKDCITKVLKSEYIEDSDYCMLHHPKAVAEYHRLLKRIVENKSHKHSAEMTVKRMTREYKKLEKDLKKIAKNLNYSLRRKYI